MKRKKIKKNYRKKERKIKKRRSQKKIKSKGKEYQKRKKVKNVRGEDIQIQVKEIVLLLVQEVEAILLLKEKAKESKTNTIGR